MGLFSDFVDSVFGDDADIFYEDEFDFDTGQFIEGSGAGFLGRLLDYFTDTDSGRGIASLLGSFALNQSGVLDPKIPQTGYAGGIPEYQAMRRQVPVATGIEQINQTVRPMGTPAGDVGSTGRVLPLMYDPNRRPGSGGRRYFTDIEYAPTGRDMGEDKAIDSTGIAAAQTRQDQQSSDLLRRNLSNLAREERARRSGALPLMAGPMPTNNYTPPQPEPTDDPSMGLPPDSDDLFLQNFSSQLMSIPRSIRGGTNEFGQEPMSAMSYDRSYQELRPKETPTDKQLADFNRYRDLMTRRDSIMEERRRSSPPQGLQELLTPLTNVVEAPTNQLPPGQDGSYARGGITALKKGKYLNGNTDGMADKVPATIDGKQPAALSDGEFVIPADVVSHLGNGNSDAGAKVLEQMMARVRKERTGNKEQGKEITARNMLPA